MERMETREYQKSPGPSAGPRLLAPMSWVDKMGTCRRMGHLDLARPFTDCTLALCTSPTLRWASETDLIVWRPCSEPRSESSLVKMPSLPQTHSHDSLSYGIVFRNILGYASFYFRLPS